MSKIIKSLIKNGYIERERIKGGIQKGKATYEYKIITPKIKLLLNDSSSDYYKDINKILNFFIEKINLNSINKIEAKKNLKLLLYTDKYC